MTIEKPLAPCELPSESEAGGQYGSDVVAQTLRALEIPYVALVPGSSLRGLHDSIVNRLGNVAPQLIVCLHEEASVAIAQGYAKITGRAMAVGLHANVGLMHAVMSVYNAWCDRMPILLLGGTGPTDAAERRPWIDWIHTTRDQAFMIRGSVKWDDTPSSPAAAREGLARAKWIAETCPMGPVYVNLDVELQEDATAELPPLDLDRLMPKVSAGADLEAIKKAAKMLREAKFPFILMGRGGRNPDVWNSRVELAESLGAKVATNLKLGAVFPTDHPLHSAPPATFLRPEANAALREADVILALDWLDLAGTFARAFNGEAPDAKVISVSKDHTIHNGVNMDHQAQPVVDLFLSADPDQVVGPLAKEIGKSDRTYTQIDWQEPDPADCFRKGQRTINGLAAELIRAVGSRAVTLTNLPLSWNGGFWPFRGPLDYVGGDGASGLGAGPGIAVGQALALKGSGRLPVSICGDGDFLMGHTALWTAVHYKLPLLVIVANNRCYFNDVGHQETVAKNRGRNPDNKWIGQMLTDPDIDIAAMGRSLGTSGWGPVRTGDDLNSILRDAIARVDQGGVAVVDVQIASGYA